MFKITILIPKQFDEQFDIKYTKSLEATKPDDTGYKNMLYNREISDHEIG